MPASHFDQVQRYFFGVEKLLLRRSLILKIEVDKVYCRRTIAYTYISFPSKAVSSRSRSMDIDTPEKDFSPVISVLLGSGISIVELFTALLSEKRFKKHLLTKNLLENAKIIIELLLGHACLPDDARDMACALAEPMYAREIQALADNSDWHFGAQQAAPEDIEDFGLNRMAEGFSKTAPRVWALLDALLKARKCKKSLLLQSAPVAVYTGDTNELFDLD